MKKVFPLIILLLIASCKKESDATPVVATDTINQSAAPQARDAAVDSLSVYIAQLNDNRAKTKAALATASAKEANKMYDKLVADNQVLVQKINKLEENFLADFYAHFSGEESHKPDKIINDKSAKLKEGGLEFLEEGEGYVAIQLQPDYYKKIFSAKVEKDYQRYIDLVAHDDKELYSADAGIIIPWEDLGKRLINWENFLKEYPGSTFKKQAEGFYHEYRYAFLMGYDNTPVIEYTTNIINEEPKNAFIKFAKEHPASPVMVYVNMLLEDPKNLDKVAKEVNIAY